MKHSYLTIIVLVFFLSSCGGIFEPWVKSNDHELPWCAPGKKAQEYTKSYFSNMMDSVVTVDVEWENSKGKRRDAYKYQKRIVNYFKKKGFIDKWEPSGKWFDGIEQKVAQYKIYLTSIDPEIVILIPYDFGNNFGKRSSYDIVGFPIDNSFSSSYFINHINYGTSTLYHPSPLYFRPNSNSNPKPIKIDQYGNYVIDERDVRLVLLKRGNSFETKREK